MPLTRSTDYDEWGRACDAPGEWSYEALRPYFKKAEKFHVPPGLRGVSSDKPGTRDAHGDVDLAHRGLDGVYETSFGAYNVRGALPVARAWY